MSSAVFAALEKMASMLEQGDRVRKQRAAAAAAKSEVHALQHEAGGTTADALAGEIDTAATVATRIQCSMCRSGFCAFSFCDQPSATMLEALSTFVWGT